MQDGVSEQGLVGNHIYAMPRPTSLAANETKQLALLSANDVAVVIADTQALAEDALAVFGSWWVVSRF